jgi:hypothetical protein
MTAEQPFRFDPELSDLFPRAEQPLEPPTARARSNT